MALLALINHLDKSAVKFFLKIGRWLKAYFLLENEFRGKIQGLIDWLSATTQNLLSGWNGIQSPRKDEGMNRLCDWLTEQDTLREFPACGDIFPRSPSTCPRQKKLSHNFCVLVLTVQLPDVDKYLDKLNKILDKSFNIL